MELETIGTIIGSILAFLTLLAPFILKFKKLTKFVGLVQSFWTNLHDLELLLNDPVFVQVFTKYFGDDPKIEAWVKEAAKILNELLKDKK